MLGPALDDKDRDWLLLCALGAAVTAAATKSVEWLLDEVRQRVSPARADLEKRVSKLEERAREST